jgi:hypothetical protein
MSRFSCTSARTPPRELDPRAVPYPNRSMIRAIHSPSKFSLVITMIPRSRNHIIPGRMRPCQKQKMGGRPERSTASRCSRPSTR